MIPRKPVLFLPAHSHHSAFKLCFATMTTFFLKLLLMPPLIGLVTLATRRWVRRWAVG